MIVCVDDAGNVDDLSAAAVDYSVTVERIWGRPLGNKAQLKIIRHQGTPDESEELVTVAVTSNVSLPVPVKFAAGRRTETAYVPPTSVVETPRTPTTPVATTERILSKLRAVSSAESTGVQSSMGGGASTAASTS